jgi:hypothetical protein
MPEEFHTGPNEPLGHTNAMAVVGRDTAWPGARSRRFNEIADDPRRTLLVTAAPRRSTLWTAPNDLTLDEASQLLTEPPARSDRQWRPGFASSTHLGARVIPAEGYVTFTGREPNFEAVRRRFRIGDEPQRSKSAPQSWPQPWRVYHYGKLVGLVSFIAAALWPLGWIWNRKRVKRNSFRYSEVPRHAQAETE